MKHMIATFLTVWLISGVAWSATTITYQGQLLHNGEPFTGSADLTFALIDAPTMPPAGVVHEAILLEDHPVNNGLFQAELDFGDVFNGDPRYLVISVNGELISPNQPVRAAPFALRAVHGGAQSPWSVSGDDIEYMDGRVGIGRSPSDFVVIDSGMDWQNSDFSFGTGALRVLVRDPDTGGGLTKFRVLGNGGVAIGNSFNSTGVPTDGLRVNGLAQFDGGVNSPGDFTAQANSYFNGTVFANIFEPTSGGTTELCRSTIASPSQPDRYGLTYCTSSARFKHDIRPVTSATELVDGLRPVRFRWNESGEEDFGLIAEEVAEVEPSLASFDGNGQVQGVKYRNLAAVLLAAVQEQRAEQIRQLAARDAEIVALREALEVQRLETAERLAALESLLTEGRQLAGGRQ